MTDAEKDKWLKDHPNAWETFKTYAYQVARTGRNFGFKAVAERVRWDSYFSKDKRGFKWSNSVTTYAGKRFLQQYPQFRNQVTIKGENK